MKKFTHDQPDAQKVVWFVIFERHCSRAAHYDSYTKTPRRGIMHVFDIRGKKVVQLFRASRKHCLAFLVVNGQPPPA